MRYKCKEIEIWYLNVQSENILIEYNNLRAFPAYIKEYYSRLFDVYRRVYLNMNFQYVSRLRELTYTFW